MRAASAGLLLALLAGCRVEQDADIRQQEDGSIHATVRSPTYTVGTRYFDGNGKEMPAPPRLEVSQGTKVIDQARVLSPAEQASLNARVADVAERIGRKLTIVLLRPEGGQSLEMVAWAIAPQAEPSGPMMLVVDVGTGSVRVDGISDPVRAAAMARAIGGDVRQGRVAAGLNNGLDQIVALEQGAA